MEQIGQYIDKKRQALVDNKQKRAIDILTGHDLLNTDFGEEEWFLPNLIPLQTVNMIGGQPSSMKTWFCLDMCIKAIQGGMFLNHFAIEKQHKVLLLDRENHARHVQKRLIRLGIPTDETSNLFHWSNQDSLWLDDRDDVAHMVQLVRKSQYTLVIFDSLRRFHNGDENDSRHMNIIMRSLAMIAKAGATVLCVHHHRKEMPGMQSSNSIRGSSDIFAGLDSSLALEYKKRDKKLILRQFKLRQSIEHDPICIEIKADGDSGPMSLVLTETEQAIAGDELADEILRALKMFAKFVSLKELKTVLQGGHTDAVTRETLGLLVGEEKIQKKVAQNNTFLYAPLDVPLQE